MAFIDEIKRNYLQGSMLMRIIFINIAVFILISIVSIGALLMNVQVDSLLRWVELPSDLGLLLKRPWTLLTYMFAHYRLLHILFNMLWLYWLGRIFMEYFSPKQMTGVYLLGGFGGAVLYLLAYNLFPYFSGNQGFMLGASASVIAVVVATAVYAPDYKIGLLFFGEVSIKWIAIVTVSIDLLGLNPNNIGVNIAHLGGAFVGIWFALRMKSGHDITRPLNAVIDAISGFFNGRSFKFPEFKKKSSDVPRGGKSAQPHQAGTNQVNEDELDIILGKIKVAGYDALTDEEKEKLFKASRRRSP